MGPERGTGEDRDLDSKLSLHWGLAQPLEGTLGRTGDLSLKIPWSGPWPNDPYSTNPTPGPQQAEVHPHGPRGSLDQRPKSKPAL